MKIFKTKQVRGSLVKPIHNQIYWYNVPVMGWVIPPEKVQFIEIKINNCDIRKIDIGTDCRPDLLNIFPSISNAEKGGFFGAIHLGNIEGVYEMEFQAILVGGATHYLGKRKIVNSKNFIARPPAIFHLGLTTRCHMSCIMCPVHANSMIHKDQIKDIEPAVLSQALDDLEKNAKSIKRIILSDFGEPLLCKGFFDIIDKIHQRCPQGSIFLNTNGSLLTEDNIQKIIDAPLNEISISLDAATKDTYGKIRKSSDFDTVFLNLKRLIQQKHKFGKESLKIYTNFVIMKSNLHELPEYVRMTGQIGVDLIVAVHPFGLFPGDSNELILKGFQKVGICDNDNYTKLLKETREIGKNGNYPLCIIPDHSTAPRLDCRCYGASCPRITPNGDVYPCAALSIKGYEEDPMSRPFGNLNNSSLEDIWRSELYSNFRRAFSEGKLPHPLCEKCAKYYNL